MCIRDRIQDLRARLPHTFFLVPGYGAQGGTAEDVKYAFNEKGHGAIVNSSRGIMCAWKKTGGDGHDFQEAARNAAIAMKEDLSLIHISRRGRPGRWRHGYNSRR